MQDKIVIVIQARMGSSRLPGKVMLPILGQSLLARMIERLHMVKHPVTLVVATSVNEADDVIAQEAEALGVACYRGSENNLLDRHYQAALLLDATVVLKIPSDCPMIDPAAIDAALEYFFAAGSRFDYISNLHPATWPDGNDVEIMTMQCLTHAHQQATRQLELEHTTPYIWENPEQFRIGNIAWETGLDYSMSHRFTIDYQEDYEFIKAVFEALYPSKTEFPCADILNLLEQRPDIMAINSAYAGVNWYRHHLDELKTIDAGQTKTITPTQHSTH
ncbi:cytidylyltransferase domain-containing protein [Mucilaginibacter psychrotolerans]|uniref:Acylneuraminate cytidylyltransferase n=1 Tax=Mucilaginibacter psychrotolerans TaxID=1524096 RepID=A0A4Y8SEB9_9SPHI|nr:glycosyltransferase family protein [Mucilaginibacter psychrotolerans]TFF37238.1 acylneuraminate cytidylyltransferase [Mucilaginibacter psychrotolerans]